MRNLVWNGDPDSVSLVKSYRNSGFSLVELVTVILLLSILGVFALGRFGDQNIFAARGFFDDTVAAVRFAQKLAISSGCDVQVVTTASSYELRQSSSCTADDFVNLVPNKFNTDTVINFESNKLLT